MHSVELTATVFCLHTQKTYKSKKYSTGCSNSFFLFYFRISYGYHLGCSIFCRVFQAKEEWEDGWRPGSSFTSTIRRVLSGSPSLLPSQSLCCALSSPRSQRLHIALKAKCALHAVPMPPHPAFTHGTRL